VRIIGVARTGAPVRPTPMQKPLGG